MFSILPAFSGVAILAHRWHFFGLLVHPRRISVTEITPKPDHERPSILVVDDEEALRTNLSRALTRAGFRVTVAAHGAEALAMLDADPTVRLVLTDLVMPVMDGRRLARTLAERSPGLPVLCMTGYADGLDDGPPDSPWSQDRIIAKPFSVLDVVARIRASID
jgi:CheY-like chemotaxis protein